LIEDIEQMLKELEFNVFKEVLFSDRKYRADWFIPLAGDVKTKGKFFKTEGFGLIIEYQGLNYRGTNSAHQTAKGLIRDNSKHNLAVSLGNIVLYCNNETDIKLFREQILNIINSQKRK
jgi:hypothetical protein